MARSRYIRQIGKNEAEINIDSLPECAFIGATKVLDIYKFKILSNSSREQLNIPAGAPDVEIQAITGEKTFITRQQLQSEYIHSSGRPIKLKYLRSDKGYIAYKQCNEQYRILKLPNNCRGILRGKRVKAGNYVIGKEQGQGIDRGNIVVLSPVIFRKAFKIPINTVIKRGIAKRDSRGIGNREFSMANIHKETRRITNRAVRNNRNAVEMPQSTVGINIPNMQGISMPNMQGMNGMQSFNGHGQFSLPNEQMRVNNIQGNRNSLQNRQAQNIVNQTSQQSKQIQQIDNQQQQFKYRAIARLVTMDSKKIVGFMIQEIKSGEKKQLTIGQVKALCKSKSVSNLMLVHKDGTNITYLRGNNIVIDNLPEIIV